MPLPTKSLREVSAQLGIPEAEIRALVDLKKVRAYLKNSVLTFAPDEIAKIVRQRKTIPESSLRSSTAEQFVEAKPAPPKKVPPKRAPPRKFQP